jgi:hypothetical protein
MYDPFRHFTTSDEDCISVFPSDILTLGLFFRGKNSGTGVFICSLKILVYYEEINRELNRIQ